MSEVITVFKERVDPVLASTLKDIYSSTIDLAGVKRQVEQEVERLKGLGYNDDEVKTTLCFDLEEIYEDMGVVCVSAYVSTQHFEYCVYKDRYRINFRSRWHRKELNELGEKAIKMIEVYVVRKENEMLKSEMERLKQYIRELEQKIAESRKGDC